ncbi:MAG: translational GTPase TypA [Chloroflexi bacterium]|nr:translational GTPase TypA [Chloroflexota bacterium]
MSSSTLTETPVRNDLRNIAIIAHVDHGKTTLVDAMLKQSNIFRANQSVGELIMDSNALEREKGITILAKNTAVQYRGVTINIIDTPGHADFSGEVERVLNMADGCLLLVDAVDGPMPQTRFVLNKALELNLKPLVVINKVDRPNARPAVVLGMVQDLFLELASHEDHLEFEVVYTNGREGLAGSTPTELADSLAPLFEAILQHIPAPTADLNGGFQMLVTAISYDEYKGRTGIGRVARGSYVPGDPLVVLNAEGQALTQRGSQVYRFEGLARVPVEEAKAGDIVMITSLEGVQIGDTVANANTPDALPRLEVEQPTVQMTFGVNTSPMAGREGKFVTSRQLRARLWRELETNVALRVEETGSADVFLVSGRGELHLSILVETMRREGYELEVSRPQAITHQENGKTVEPIEQLVIDTIDENVGPLTEQLAARQAQMTNLENDGRGRVRLEYSIPTRGLIGFRNAFLTLTRGEGQMSSLLLGFEPLRGPLQATRNGSLIASEAGTAVTYGLANAQGRGQTMIDPQTEVYEGMVVGINSREDDLAVNVCREKKMTNIRSSTSDIAVRLTPPVRLSLEESLDFLAADELLEVTPKSFRIRKRLLAATERARAAKRAAGR